MKDLELIFKEKTNDISFLELRENATITINNYKVETELPLPIITNTLVWDIKRGNLEEEINLANVVEGIIYLIGADPNFLYIKEYKRIYKQELKYEQLEFF